MASACNELAAAAELGVSLFEAALPVNPPVSGACELLGLDPLYVANEGRFLVVCPEDHVDRALEILAAHSPQSDSEPARIGTVDDAVLPAVTPTFLPAMSW